jgi:Pentapeptide repeats (8 copies)
MVNPEQLEYLQDSAEERNIYRREKAITRPDLIRADLLKADLRAIDLTGANLAHADLIGANLSGAFLLNVDLSGANLTGADLTGTNLTGEVGFDRRERAKRCSLLLNMASRCFKQRCISDRTGS